MLHFYFELCAQAPGYLRIMSEEICFLLTIFCFLISVFNSFAKALHIAVSAKFSPDLSAQVSAWSQNAVAAFKYFLSAFCSPQSSGRSVPSMTTRPTVRQCTRCRCSQCSPGNSFCGAFHSVSLLPLARKYAKLRPCVK